MNIVYFYLPRSKWPDDFPQSPHSYWHGFRDGIYCWTLQTYLRLRETGYPCALTDTIPSRGIIIAHRGLLPDTVRPTRHQLLVCIQADWSRHPFAQVHIVQNRAQEKPSGVPLIDRLSLPGKSIFVHLWRQPGLLPRNHGRSEFSQIAYLGRPENLAAELRTKEWADLLGGLGLRWRIIDDPSQWHDYSQIDGIVSARSFGVSDYIFKPATKLYNAWAAGVPAILGPESAFRDERRSDLDYIEANSLTSAFNALRYLRDNPPIRNRIISNGFRRASDTDPERIVEKWRAVLEDTISTELEAWRQLKPYRRVLFYSARSLALLFNKARSRTGPQ